MIEQEKLSPTVYTRPFSNRLVVVIGLIAAVCLAAGFAAASQNLALSQRWLLITFLIVFAVFGLSISVWLILRESRRAMIGRDYKEIVWQVISPANQKRKLNDEVRELAKILGIADGQLSDLMSAYIVAEDLALRKIQQEEKRSLFRHISIDKVDFDAVLLNEDTINFIDVTFLVAPDFPQEKISLSAEKIAAARKSIEKNYADPKIKLLFVLVTQLDEKDGAKLRSTLNKSRFSAVPVDVDISFYDFEELQKVYAMD